MILTERLELIPATPSSVHAALDAPAALAAALDASVPPTWPPEYLDPDSLTFTLARLAEGPDQAGWWLHFVVLRPGTEARTLIGSAGFCGRPTPEGVVEVGYGIVSDRRRRGFASETVRGLVAHAFAHPSVRRVIAHTLPDLTPSIGVLTKCGFQLVDEAPAPGVIRFALAREAMTSPVGAV
jgi:ribosomal-protein-alanine N-acetyltransferase